VVKIKRITPYINFGAGQYGSFYLAIFTNISVMAVLYFQKYQKLT